MLTALAFRAGNPLETKKYDEPLSRFAYIFNLRPYTEGNEARGKGGDDDSDFEWENDGK